MKPFNLDEYLANPSKEVITRDGRKVQIRCTDVRSAKYPIVALVEKHSLPEDNVFTYTRDGRHFVCQESDDDLYFVPEKREGWINIYKNDTGGYTLGSEVYSNKEHAEVMACRTCLATVKIEWEE